MCVGCDAMWHLLEVWYFDAKKAETVTTHLERPGLTVTGQFRLLSNSQAPSVAILTNEAHKTARLGTKKAAIKRSGQPLDVGTYTIVAN